MSSTEATQLQQQRQLHLQQSCAENNDSWSLSRISLAGSDNMRFLYCKIGKAACTSWLRVLLRLTGNPAAQRLAAKTRNVIHSAYQHYLTPHQLKPVQLSRGPFNAYYKFMFVREPLERLVSAFRDRLFRVPAYFALRRSIVRKFRRNPSPR